LNENKLGSKDIIIQLQPFAQCSDFKVNVKKLWRVFEGHFICVETAAGLFFLDQ